MATTVQTNVEPAAASAASRFPQLLRSKREQTLLLTLLLVLVTMALYAPALRNDFVNYDDPDYVTANDHVQQGLSWSNAGWAITSFAAANWHPLTWISHMADVQLFGLRPAGHHLVSILWHMLNVVLLFLLLRRATGYPLRSATVAALFALCPLNVEAVAWIAERKSVLCAAFFFLTLFAYGWYVRRPSAGRYLAVAAIFALGLTAKPMIVTLPAVLLLMDYWPLERIEVPGAPVPGRPPFGANFAKLVAEKLPLLVLSLACTAMEVRAASVGGALGSTVLLPMKLRIENAVYSYLIYLAKGVWPTRLAVFYPHPENSLALWKVALAGFVLLAITGVVWHYRQKRYLLTGWLWYLVTMLPMIGLTQAGRQAMADRYAYIPFVGLFVIVVWLASELAKSIPVTKWAMAAITVGVLCGYTWDSYVQIGYWQNSITLFSHALQVTTRSDIAENNLGEALVQLGRPDLALPHLERALEYQPQYSQAHYNLAVVLQRQNRLEPALQEYRLALAHPSDSQEAARAHNNLGTLFLQLNRPAEALSEYNAALQIKPNEVTSLLGRGLLEYRGKSLTAAEQDFRRAIQITPSARAWLYLGLVREEEGDLKSAMNAYQAAAKIAPNMTEVQRHINEVRGKLAGPPN